ncbi:MAG: YbdK family carboxylate-amine ligase, partial [Boseongicola sp. SB0664_bin_43]|nr:YbdK family carboxylate-amine ligase [Boseongicola sp. SB0664_bin_43]
MALLRRSLGRPRAGTAGVPTLGRDAGRWPLTSRAGRANGKPPLGGCTTGKHRAFPGEPASRAMPPPCGGGTCRRPRRARRKRGGEQVNEIETDAKTLQPDDDEFAITLGIEEEFFLVDPGTRDLIADPDVAIFEASEKASGAHKIVREFLRAQIESNTRVCSSVATLRQALRETRGTIIEAAEQHGAAVLAASTHPFASQTEQMTTPKKRYDNFASRFQENVRQFVVGGMHVHAGFGDADSRIRIMTVLRNYLPLLHALSTSSPFSQGRLTGFKSWRLTLMGGLPRTGIPGPLHSWDEYE